MKMIDVWWLTGIAARPHENLENLSPRFFEAHVRSPTLVAFDPEYRTLSNDEATEVRNERTLGGRAVRWGE